MLQIYNTLSRRKEPLTPIHPGRVGIYVCGMTVYDYCHLGHARVLVAFDVVVRYLRSLGYAVTYVRNITDIDDKIIRRAAERSEDFAALTARFIDAMHADGAALGLLEPDREPRATEHIDVIIAMIERLVERGFAYRAASGDVYYDVSRFEHYGRLAGKRLEDLRSGERVAVDASKDDPLDFVLWKPAKPGEPQWASPWGPGRPGWHIECSAMSTACLGAHFDIHGGGMDLQFPHHENEIAQSEGANGHSFVNLWMHNGFVRIDEEKMSKSLGNFFTVREILAKFPGEAVRFFMLSSHYRSPLNYSEQGLAGACSALGRIYTALRGVSADEAGDLAPVGAYREQFTAAMDDDFNTPEALAVLFQLARDLNRARQRDDGSASSLAAQLRELGGTLGILQGSPEAYLQGVPGDAGGLTNAAIESLIVERRAARDRREWGVADDIREQLAAAGVVLEDGPQGTEWRRENRASQGS